MKVLHVTTSYPTNSSDVSGRFIYRLVKSLNATGVKPEILTPDCAWTPKWPGDIRVHSYRYFIKPYQRLCHYPGGIPEAVKKRPVYAMQLFPLFLFMFTRLHGLKKNFSLVHCHWSTCGLVAGLSHILKPHPFVTTLRGGDVNLAQKNRFMKMALDLTVRSSLSVICVSKQMAEDLKGTYSAYAQKIIHIPNGVSDDFFRIEPLKNLGTRQITFLFIGSLIKRKGADILLNALATVEKRQWQLKIVGDGPEKPHLKGIAQRTDIVDKVQFLGAVSPEKIPALMEQADCVVIPSRFEGRPNVLVEAMAAARPVVISDIPGARELVQNDVNGWIFRTEAEKELAEIIKSILEKKEQLPGMGEKGRKVVENMGLTWQKSAEKYKAIYERALCSSGLEQSG